MLIGLSGPERSVRRTFGEIPLITMMSNAGYYNRQPGLYFVLLKHKSIVPHVCGSFFLGIFKVFKVSRHNLFDAISILK